MTDTLFNGDAFEQIRGQTWIETPPRVKPGDNVVFRLALDHDRSGTVLGDHGAFGIQVDERATGKTHFVAASNVRHETKAERRAREVDGYYVEDGALPSGGVSRSAGTSCSR